MTAGNTIPDLEKIFRQATQNHQNNNLIEACRLYNIILEQVPDSPLVNYNLGLALFELDRCEESYNCYQIALGQAPGNTDILYNLALCTKKMGDFDRTVQIYETILTRTPDDYNSLYNLGCCFKDMLNHERAISTFLRVLEISPNHQPTISNIAFLHHKNDDFRKAELMYEKLLLLNPNNCQAKHMLASLRGDLSNPAPLEYIEQMFDGYSGYYEDSLVAKLEYKVPKILRDFFDETSEHTANALKILDLGCGTGLAGTVFKDLSSSLTGIDISQKMIEIAAAKGIYDSLITIGIAEYLEGNPPAYELIIATDVFTYIGDLQSIFRSLAHASEPNASFCFSIEKSTSDYFELRNTGRFAHSLTYLRTITSLTGWKIIRHTDVDLRRERNAWIKGILFFLKKEPSPFKVEKK
jgi:predicted TPR repeat methyltransferase